MTEDQDVIQDDIDNVADNVGGHRDPRHPAPGEKRGGDVVQYRQERGEHQHRVIRALEHRHLGPVTEQPECLPSQRNQAEHQQVSPQGVPDTLPDSAGAHAPVSRAVIVGHEEIDKPGDGIEKSGGGPGEHRRGPHRRNLIDPVPGQKQPVDKHHDQHGALIEDQRQADPDQTPSGGCVRVIILVPEPGEDRV